MNLSSKSAITQSNNSVLPNEDPDLTISDDNDDKHNEVKNNHQKKCHGRWPNQEQLIFLKNLVSCKNDFKQLINFLSSRNLPQIKIHTLHFLRMCKKEFEVSKTKQQNKLILNHICNNYGFHPNDSYLEQLEEIILNPSKEMMKNLRKVKMGLKKPMRNANTTSAPQNKTNNNSKQNIEIGVGVGSKEKIFLITKIPKKESNVINILTINVMGKNSKEGYKNSNVNGSDDNGITSHGIMSQSQFKTFSFNPFNIDFGPTIMSNNTKLNKEEIVNKRKNKEERNNNNHNVIYSNNDNDNIVMSNIILNNNDKNELDSSMNESDLIN